MSGKFKLARAVGKAFRPRPIIPGTRPRGLSAPQWGGVQVHDGARSAARGEQTASRRSVAIAATVH